MHEEHGFTWMSHIPGLEHAPIHVVHAALVAVILLVTMTIARVQLLKAMKEPGGAIVPPEKMTYRNFFEILAEKLYGLCENVLGHHQAKIYYPFIGTLFVFVFSCNILGLFPGFLPPTDNMNTTFALGLFVFLYYNVEGIRANGVVGHLKHLWGPVWWLGPLMFVIELLSHCIRPFSLALRLRWNMTGDHIVLGVFTDLVPYVVPVAFMVLGTFVAFVQAFVFSLLTMVYISMSTAHDH